MSQTHTDVTRDKLYEDFNSVVAETEHLLQSLAGASADKAGALRTSVEKGVAAASDRLAKIRKAALQNARASVTATDGYVHGHPWQSVGVAAVAAGIAGLIAGLLIARR